MRKKYTIENSRTMLEFNLVGFSFTNASIFSHNLITRKQRLQDEKKRGIKM